MDFRERLLYHQIHPAKLLTDWCAAVVSFYFLWQHQLALGVAIAIVPPVLVSIAVIQFSDLYGYKKSRMGRYVHKYMSMEAHATKLFGFLVSAAGAWYNLLPVVVVGIILVVLVWLRGSFRE